MFINLHKYFFDLFLNISKLIVFVIFQYFWFLFECFLLKLFEWFVLFSFLNYHFDMQNYIIYRWLFFLGPAFVTWTFGTCGCQFSVWLVSVTWVFCTWGCQFCVWPVSVSRVFLYLGIWFACLALHLLLEFFVLGDVSCVFTCACNIYLAFVFWRVCKTTHTWRI